MNTSFFLYRNSTSRTAYDDDPYYEPFSVPKEFQDKQQLVTQNPLYEEDFPQYDMMGYVHEKEFEHVVENEVIVFAGKTILQVNTMS